MQPLFNMPRKTCNMFLCCKRQKKIWKKVFHNASTCRGRGHIFLRILCIFFVFFVFSLVARVACHFLVCAQLPAWSNLNVNNFVILYRRKKISVYLFFFHHFFREIYSSKAHLNIPDVFFLFRQAILLWAPAVFSPSATVWVRSRGKQWVVFKSPPVSSDLELWGQQNAFPFQLAISFSTLPKQIYWYGPIHVFSLHPLLGKKNKIKTYEPYGCICPFERQAILGLSKTDPS